jgi:hypothetical protein
MNRKDLFKAYFITNDLLYNQFKGLFAKIAEEDLFNWTLDLLEEKMTKKQYYEEIRFLFGMGRGNLQRAIEKYERYYKDQQKHKVK